MKRKVNSFTLYSSEGVRYRSKVNSFILYSTEASLVGPIQGGGVLGQGGTQDC